MQVVFLMSDNDELIFIQKLIHDFAIELTLNPIFVHKKDNKTLKTIATENPHLPILFFDKNSLILAMSDNNELIKVSPDWQSHQSRIVKAGKNSELLLKIAKLTNDMTAVDGTAGFGIDGLILASTGASVTFIEQNPLLFLMLIAEKTKMSQHKNWQKLMNRIEIRFGNSGERLNEIGKVDLIYLDPMFPTNSYKSLVNKNMQVLHHFIMPPSIDEEIHLFNTAIHHCDKLIIKRPISAPYFANISPVQSTNNEAIRFDKYENIFSE